MKSKAIFLALLALAFAAQAKPVSKTEAGLAARAWAASSGKFGARLGSSVESVRKFCLTNDASFFAVKMSGGAVIVAGDSDDSPIIAMSSADISDLEAGSPLRDLVEKDVSWRRQIAQSASSAEKKAAQRLWFNLIRRGEAIDAAGPGKVEPSDVAPTDMRVAPLVKSKWSQDDHGENYYTPNNYVCGCVATAMAQIMRYHSFPVDEVAVFTNNSCEVDGEITPMASIGGVFDWANMPLEPSSKQTEAEMKAIGHLTYDCGVAVGMSWTKDASGALTLDVGSALKDRFGYANAEVSDDINELSANEKCREKVIYAPIDAGYPVQLGINRTFGGAGHSIVADGYGYIDGVSYVHLNMGWSGQGDVWYHLPDITYKATSGGPTYEADVVVCCVYNIFPTETGVVVSGRTVDEEGEVVTNALVSVFRAGDDVPFTNLTSSATGVYAVILPDGEYTVVAESDGGFSGEADVSVAAENVWGHDVVLNAPSVKVISFDGVETNVYSTLDVALREASYLAAPTVEIFTNTVLKRDFTSTNSFLVSAIPGAVVDRRGETAIIVAAGVTNVFSGVVFSQASAAPVKVEKGGVAAFMGTTSVDETLMVEAEAADGFALAGDIYGGVQVRIEGAMQEGAVFGFALCDYTTAANNAAKIVHPDNPDLGAVAENVGGAVVFRWAADVAVAPDAAIAQYDDGLGATHYVRSFNQALDVGATSIVLKKSSSMSVKFTPEADVTISSENGAVLSLEKGAQVVAEAGVTVSLSDISATGADAKLDAPFVEVRGGAVELLADAVLEDISVVNTKNTYGTVAVASGSFVMESGAEIRGCEVKTARSVSSEGCGGGVYVAAGATFEMRGGEISGCSAEGYGGGVYAENGATVLLSGDATVAGNMGKSNTPSDIFVKSGDTLRVAGKMTGSVGVAGSPELFTNAVKFATAEAGVSAADREASKGAFFANKEVAVGKVLSVVVSGSDFLWSIEDEPTGPFPVEPLFDDITGLATNAEALVILGGVSNYWETVSDAFLSIKEDGAVVELQEFALLDSWLTVTNHVTLRSPDIMPISLWRIDECGINVASNATLVVEDVAFFSLGVMGRLFNVNGGKLCLYGSDISYVEGDAERAASAIVVYGGGTLEVLDGSEISYCYNEFQDTDTNSGAAGGIVAEDEGTKVYLNDCTVTGCYGRKTGGVFIGNKAEVHIAGEVNIVDNMCYDENSCGNMVVAAGAKLYLDGELTGYVGLCEGVSGDKEVFGTCTDPAFAASATNFVHDVTRARGSVSGESLVWNLAGRTPVAKPVPLGYSFTYDGNVHTALVAGAGYTLEGTAYAEEAGKYFVLARLDPGCVWDDETSDVVVCEWEIVAPAEPLPPLPADPTAESVAAALYVSEVEDPAVAEALMAADDPVAAYNSFRTWAKTVPGGTAAVCDSPNAWVSYEFGASELFENEPVVTFTSMSIEDPSTASMRVTLVVMDGETDKTDLVDPESVAALFEMSTDFKTWTDDLTATANEDGSYTVKPNDPTLTTAVIRLRY